MRKPAVFFLAAAAFAAFVMVAGAEPAKPEPEWSMNATIIEACSCPMFCQCYFNAEPGKPAHGAGHGSHAEGESGHHCKFNNAYKVNKGNYGSTKLDGAKFWVAGDLGDFASGKTEWAVLTFDPSVTASQREGIAAALGALYPVEWKSFQVASDAPVEWTASADAAHAKLGDGKLAEVALTRFEGMTSQPVVIKNLRYWAAPRNDGFIMMPNTVEAYRAGDKPFEYKGSNGFMITFDINSKDAAAAKAKMSGAM